MQSPLSNQTYKPKRRLGKLFLLLVWFGALWLVATHRQDILDWWKLHNYQAPATVAQIASQDTMTDYGRKVFYVNQPALIPKSGFSDSCPNDGGEQTIVLGCYHSGQSGIFLLRVTDPRLNGVHQVTAAHEMLHAAYERLSKGERDRVNASLLDYYNNGLSDQRVRDTIEAYKKSEPNDLKNEMHSVFGSEMASLPAPLEQYYQRYFVNRAQVAAFAAQYQAEFTSRQALAAQYSSQMDSLQTRIEALKSDLKVKEANIAAAQSNLTGLRNSGNIAAYNAGVPAYNSLVDSYNAEIAEINDLINQYNQIRSKLIAISVEEKQLIDELKPQTRTINN